MAGMSEVIRLWNKYKEYRNTRKQRRLSRRSSESWSRSCRGSEGFDEATAMIVGMGLGTEQDMDFIDYAHEDDPRFINNPYGIGCSRTYEIPYGETPISLATSPASIRPVMPRYPKINDSDELPSCPDLVIRKTYSIDMVKGKRKGRMPGDSADDRYKFMLDSPAPRAKSSKRFSLVRQRDLRCGSAY